MTSQATKDLKKTAETALTVGDSPDEFAMTKDGKKVTILKCRTRHVGLVMEFISFVMQELGIESFGQLPKNLDFSSPAVILPLLTRASSRVFNLVAALSDLTTEEVDDLELDDLITVVTQQYLVNSDFFLKNVMTSLPKGMLEITPAVTSEETSGIPS